MIIVIMAVMAALIITEGICTAVCIGDTAGIVRAAATTIIMIIVLIATVIHTAAGILTGIPTIGQMAATVIYAMKIAAVMFCSAMMITFC